MVRRSILAAGVAAMALATPAAANRLVLDIQGISPNRVIIYADEYASDRTPVGDQGPVRIKEIELVTVYEAANQPYWTETDIQFQCPNPVFALMSGKKKKLDEKWVLPAATSAQFRLVNGRTRSKQKDDSDALQPTEWQSTSSYPLMRAYRLACQEVELNHAIIASAKDGMIVQALVTKNLAALGVDGVMMAPIGYDWREAAEFTWAHFWNDVPKPPVKASRKLTPAEQAEFEARIRSFETALPAARRQAEGIINDYQAEAAFVTKAAELRGKRKLSRSEQILLNVWLYKTEQEVVAANGPPAVDNAGGIRFLSYGRAYDNRVMWQNVRSGGTMVTGGYDHCNVRYVLIPDNSNMLRVADVTVSRDRDGGIAGTNACAEIMNVPGG